LIYTTQEKKVPWYSWNIVESGIKHHNPNPTRKTIFMAILNPCATHFFTLREAYLLTLPLFVGVSCIRALSPAWTGSHALETLISCTHLFLPHDIPPTKKSSTIKSWPTFCDQYFWKFPIWNSRADEKCREIRM
jgi:hypothetical protein